MLAECLWDTLASQLRDLFRDIDRGDYTNWKEYRDLLWLMTDSGFRVEHDFNWWLHFPTGEVWKLDE